MIENGDALFDEIYAKWVDEQPGWVIYAGVHYKFVETVAGTPAFVEFTNQELFDSRSLTDSRPATYSKLDEG